ncbi:amino acid adenylation domain-containing protein [Streptomyces sp. NPDC059894]|uniref:amino acid adenylation domain-containing protein n=1 Tax=unclassified Streptomyces TaxID=2593676 RepID=UPI003668341E
MAATQRPVMPGPDAAAGRPWSCAVVGGNPLTARCAQILLDRGHRVTAFVTDDPELAAWAEEKGLDPLPYGPELEVSLRRVPVDFLFSAANLRMLSQGVLDVPRRLAVNYHDGPLPRHAGLYATSWALVESAAGPARDHGVTWHVMTAEADAGDILVQRGVPLEPDDTAFSLNAKCLHAAIESFTELVEGLEQDTVRPRPQDASLRTYRGLTDPLPDGGLLRWTRGAAELDALVRAADFGPHPNAWGAARLTGPDDVVLVTAAAVAATRSAARPGTITGLDDSALTVATADGDLRLTGFASVDGAVLAVQDLAALWHLSAGDALPLPDGAFVEAFARHSAAARRHEAFWADRLTRPAPFALPHRDPSPTAAEGRHELSVPVPRPLAAHAVAATLAFLARLNGLSGTGPFDVALSVGPPADLPHPAAGRLFATEVPLRVPGPDRSFADFRDQVAGALSAVARRGPHLRDLRTRYPRPRGTDASGTLPTALHLGAAPPPDALRGRTAAVHVAADGTRCTWLLDGREFGPEAAAGLAADCADFLAGLAEAAACDTAGPVLAVPLMSRRRRRRVLVEWNDTASAEPVLECVTTLVARQAHARPDAVAVSDEETELTYRELADRTDRVARALAARGIGPGDRVGVLLRRRADLVPVLLGTLASGAAYVPLDPVYPRRRLDHMAADARLALLLADPGAADGLGGDVPLLAPDEALRAAGRETGRLDRASPDAPAYVIYTSGSTGNPKGVQVGHRALSNFLMSMAREPGCGPDDRLLAVTTVCFDIAGLELFLPLTVGGRVDVASEQAAADGFALRTLVERTAPTVLQATPATWRMLCSAGWPGRAELRVLCGGEALPADLAAELTDRAGQVWNMYGPTETTVWSAVSRVRAGRRVTIGRPIANTRCYVLDGRGEPVPPFVPGELYIAGDGVADGYLGRPDLTAERFVREPGRPGSMYRTGDVVRHRADGELEYLHRADNQVKLHGYRIELGEIESVLAGHPAVARCVAVVHEDASHGRGIVAYVVPADAGTENPGTDNPAAENPAAGAMDAAVLRRHAEAALPRYMVPTAFVPLARIPLTDNGKVDRKALPAPVRGTAARTGPAPGTDLERLVARAWREALPAGEFGLDDNFFESGGNSLNVVDVVARLRADSGTDLVVVDMFRCPTIRTMAARLGGTAGADTARRHLARPDRSLISRRRARLSG